eukprot:6042080-Prymnesium_polylepis.1
MGDWDPVWLGNVQGARTIIVAWQMGRLRSTGSLDRCVGAVNVGTAPEMKRRRRERISVSRSTSKDGVAGVSLPARRSFAPGRCSP